MEKKAVNQIFVVKVYASNTVKPILVEVFPNTEIGLRDAENYAEILTRNSGYSHIVVLPVNGLRMSESDTKHISDITTMQ